MASRKKLKGVAHGLLGTFVSRNNDVDGYWGLGKLRKFAETIGKDEIQIDLLSDAERPMFLTTTTTVQRVYRDWLLNAAPKFGVRFQDLAAAQVILRFTTFDEMPDVRRDTRGFPYVCTVILRNRFGARYAAQKVGVCGPHDPYKESRRLQETVRPE